MQSMSHKGFQQQNMCYLQYLINLCKSEITHCFALCTLQHLRHFQKGKDGVFDAMGKRMSPSDGSCHGRLVPIQWWIVLLCLKYFIYAFHLQQNQQLNHEATYIAAVSQQC